jgi:hypothetical protein
MRSYRKSVTGALLPVKAALAGSVTRRHALALPMLF